MTAPLSEFTVQNMYFKESISIRRQKIVLSLIKSSCHSKTEQTKEMKMKIIAGTTDFTIEEMTAVAIGKFDGIHKGHKRLLDEIFKARNLGLKTAVFTFDTSPAVVF